MRPPRPAPAREAAREDDAPRSRAPAPAVTAAAGGPGPGAGLTPGPRGHPAGVAGAQGGSPTGHGLSDGGAGDGGGGAALVPPALVGFQQPDYPSNARRGREEGRVLVAVTVSAQGEPESVHVVSSSGHPSLDAAAVDALRSARYRPAHRGSAAVSASKTVSIVFRLDR